MLLYDGKIDRFDGENHFMSNFHDSPIVLKGELFLTVEHAFAAAKTTDPVARKQIQLAKTPGIAKRLGRKVELREDWETVKVPVMEYLVKLKFNTHEDLARKLLATGNAYLEEGNHWGDKFWGVCDGEGKNNLGFILMRVRDSLCK